LVEDRLPSEEEIEEDFFDTEEVIPQHQHQEIMAQVAVAPQVILRGEKMPILKKKLTERSVKQFIQLFENWATAAGIKDDGVKKHRFTTAFESDLASQWFFINNDTIIDPVTTFDNLKTSFIQNCPKDETEKDLCIYDVNDHPQEEGEGPLAYVTRIRYNFGENWNKYNGNAAEVIEVIVKQMLPRYRRYIQYRGVPADWKDLVKLISEYEGKGMKEIDDLAQESQKSQTKIKSKPADPQVAELTKALENLTVKLTKMEQEQGRSDRRTNQERSSGQGRSSPRQQDLSRPYEDRRCFVCGKQGHVAAKCFRNQGNGGYQGNDGYRSSFRGRGFGRGRWNGGRGSFRGNFHPRFGQTGTYDQPQRFQNFRGGLYPAIEQRNDTNQGNERGRVN